MTGYTGTLVEKDLSLEAFIWSCARAFSPLIDMRDAPSDAPIPHELKVDAWYQENVNAAQKELDEWLELDEAARLAWARRISRSTRDSGRDHVAEQKARMDKMEAILQGVRDWTPPTDEHQGLKDFMIQQLEDSISFGADVSHHLTHDAPPDERVIQDLVRGREEYLREQLARRQDSLDKEQARIRSNNEWLRQLRASIGAPPS